VGELLKVESRMGLFKQWIRRRILKPNEEKIPGVWRKLHSKEAKVNNLFVNIFTLIVALTFLL